MGDGILFFRCLNGIDSSGERARNRGDWHYVEFDEMVFDFFREAEGNLIRKSVFSFRLEGDSIPFLRFRSFILSSSSIISFFVIFSQFLLDKEVYVKLYIRSNCINIFFSLKVKGKNKKRLYKRRSAKSL